MSVEKFYARSSDDPFQIMPGKKNVSARRVVCARIVRALGFFIAAMCTNSASAIVGGFEAWPGQFPYMVQTNNTYSTNNTHTCGGVLVAPQWVLTAAHCHQNTKTEDLFVVLGAHSEAAYDTTETRQTIPVMRKVVHPDGKYAGWGSGKTDLLLLELQSPATLNDRVQTIAINWDLAFGHSGNTVTMGWGATCDGCRLSSVLKGVNMPVVSANGIGIVIGAPDSFQSICYSDSGGPWVRDGLLIGITSTTFTPKCTGQAGVADVAKNAAWINNVITNPANGTVAPAVSVIAAQVVEGQNFVNVPVRLSEFSNQTVSVSVATDNGSATTGDYYGIFQQVVFNPGETQKTVRVAVIDDTTTESEETFTVRLFNASGADIFKSRAVVTITDDDSGSGSSGGSSSGGSSSGASSSGSGRTAFSIRDVTVSENIGSAQVTVNLSQPLSYDASVKFATRARTAEKDEDFYGTFRELSFVAGETSKTIALTVIDDSRRESDEQLEVRLFDATGASIATTNSTVTILDDDAGGGGSGIGGSSGGSGSSSDGGSGGGNSDGVPTVSARWASVNESAGTVDVPIRLNSTADGIVSVDVQTVDQTAVAGADYFAMYQSLVFQPGETEKNVTIGVINDGAAEAVKSFNLRLVNLQGLRMGDGQVSITILDDD